MTESAIEAFHISCPIRGKPRDAKNPWWNNALEKQGKKVRGLLRKAERTKHPDDWEAFHASQREYKRSLRSAKRDSWRRFCSDINELPAACRLSKILSKNPHAGIGSLARPNGGFTSNAGETLEVLLQTHFPDSKANVDHLEECRRPGPMDYDTGKRVVTYERLVWSIKTFPSFKSPGRDGVYPALLQHGMDTLALGQDIQDVPGHELRSLSLERG